MYIAMGIRSMDMFEINQFVASRFFHSQEVDVDIRAIISMHFATKTQQRELSVSLVLWK